MYGFVFGLVWANYYKLSYTPIIVNNFQMNKKAPTTVICTQNPGHIDFMNQARQHMDVSLYFTGGIHFVFA